MRKTRWIFWTRLVQISWNYSQVLDEYLWLLMLNEHFIDYQLTMREQVQRQLAYYDANLIDAA